MNETFTQWNESLLIPGQPDEHEVKELLQQNSIPCPKGVRLLPSQTLSISTESVESEAPSSSPSEAEVRVTFPGPYVVKVCSGKVLHKTEHGGVSLNVDNASLATTVEEMRDRFHGSPVLVERQLQPVGPEFILGALTDPDFGLSVMAGAGGILTELYRDVTFRLAPLSEKEALDMLQELTVSPVLAGYRNLDLDGESLAKIITAVGALAEAAGPLFGSLDLNPLVYTKQGWRALDAKLVWEK